LVEVLIRGAILTVRMLRMICERTFLSGSRSISHIKLASERGA
jgi:hypothetical protein